MHRYSQLTAPPVCHCRYLQEVGYTDTILDVKSQRVRALLGLAGDGSTGGGGGGERGGGVEADG